MKTKKTLTLEIGITVGEIKELVIKHLAETHEEYKKISDATTKPIINFESSITNGTDVFVGCLVTITKVK